MKYGYTCQCGWRLNRTGTRREYAAAKEHHAFREEHSVDGVPTRGCEFLRKELEQSRKVAAK
jgi:hypothetical protein